MNRALTALLAASMAALAPAGAWAGTPAAGVDQQIRSGFFADVNLGGFFTATGADATTGSKGISNAQAYLQLGIGYDILKTANPEDRFGLAVGLHFGLGSSAASCFSSVKNNVCVYDQNGSSTDPTNVASDNFTVMMFGAEVIFKVRLVDRLFLRPRLEGGYAMLDPAPLQNTSGGAYVGGGVGVEYATLMDHFSIGLDLGTRFIIGPNIPAFTVYPMVKYTF